MEGKQKGAAFTRGWCPPTIPAAPKLLGRPFPPLVMHYGEDGHDFMRITATHVGDHPPSNPV